MTTSSKAVVLQDLDQLFRRGITASGDGALIDRFLTDGNELAFEALVARHGPMVRGVCRRLLGNPNDVDDAFQATFLVLVRKARHLRDPDRLGPWLYGVAKRVATKTRTRTARHRHEPPVDVCSREEFDAEWLDVMPILDDELGQLPSKHRDVLILCLLDGATADEAATQLGCPVGTVKSRLARARDSLRQRLTVRGIAPAVALAVVSSDSAFASPVSSTLARATLELLGKSSIAPGIAALTQGVLSIMPSKSIVISSVLMAGVAVAGLGTARWLTSSHAQEPRPVVEAQGRVPGNAGAQEERTNNMKQILLAFHNYYNANGHLPALANFGGDGLPKLSWRVALLPYLAEGDLFAEFRQDEPWDSPHNKDLIGRMPAVFRTPDSPVPSGQTRFRGFAGKGAMFEGVRGIKFEEVTDGTSNTVLIAMATDPVTWTQPGELPFVAGERLPALEVTTPHGYALGIADGSVRMFPTGDRRKLRAIITRDGGEVITWPPAEGTTTADPVATGGVRVPSTAPTDLTSQRLSGVTPPAAALQMKSSYGSTPPESLEQRLQKVEQKLERILQRLDRLSDDNHSPRP
jgi:RNA polymerase sigma factor (sigma-70 family)